MKTLKKILLSIYTFPLLAVVLFINVVWIILCILLGIILLIYYWLCDELAMGSFKQLIYLLTEPTRLWYLTPIWNIEWDKDAEASKD